MWNPGGQITASEEITYIQSDLLCAFLDAKLRYPSLAVWTVTWKDLHHFHKLCPKAGIPSMELFNDIQNILGKECEYNYSSFQSRT